MGDAVNDRFSYGLKKQLNKLMEENHRWMILLLTQQSEKQITIFTTHFVACLALQSSVDAYCWDREGEQKRCLLNGS